MKDIVIKFKIAACGFCLLLLVLAIASCHRDVRYPALLVQADSLLYAYPDSALSVLQSYRDSVETMPKFVRMYYDLLLTQAEDKNYITHTSDSVARNFVSFYEENGPADKLARAYYITGRVYDDMQNAPTALEYYQKAVDEALKVRDYRLVGLTYSQIGTLYIDHELEIESISAYKKAYEYALVSGDTISIPFRLVNIARAFTISNNVDSTLYY